MKISALVAIALAWATVTVGVVSFAYAGDQATEAAQSSDPKEQSIDCSKETWPNFSPACLRNADTTSAVRIVAFTRR